VSASATSKRTQIILTPESLEMRSRRRFYQCRASEIIYIQLRGAKAAILADDRPFRSDSGSEKGPITLRP
jgi:hypothetical protein